MTTVPVGFRVSKKEREALQLCAAAAEQSVSAWLRRQVRALVRRRMKTLTTPDLVAALEQHRTTKPRE